MTQSQSTGNSYDTHALSSAKTHIVNVLKDVPEYRADGEISAGTFKSLEQTIAASAVIIANALQSKCKCSDPGD